MDPYLKIKIRRQDWNQQILGVTLLVHTQGHWNTSPLTNGDITQYSSITNGRFIRIHIRCAGVGDMNGRLEIVSSDDMPIDLPRLDPKISEGPTTVKDVYDIIVGHKLVPEGIQDFCFAANGMGCRYWHITSFCLYESTGVICSGSSERVFNFLCLIYIMQSEADAIPTIVRPGIFRGTDTHATTIALWRALIRRRTFQYTVTCIASVRALHRQSFDDRSIEQWRQESWNRAVREADIKAKTAARVDSEVARIIDEAESLFAKEGP